MDTRRDLDHISNGRSICVSIIRLNLLEKSLFYLSTIVRDILNICVTFSLIDSDTTKYLLYRLETFIVVRYSPDSESRWTPC